MSQSPLQEEGSRTYEDAWQAINHLIRSDGSWSGRERNIAYRNAGDRFENISFVSGLDFNGDGRAFAVWDMDRDGDVDLLLKFRTPPQIRMMRNDTIAPRGITVQLAGRRSNADGVGAHVVLRTDKGERLAHVKAGSGYLSQSSRRVHFGLKAGEEPLELQVRWPSGQVERHGPLSPAPYRIIEGGGIERVRSPARHTSPTKPPVRSQPRKAFALLEPVPSPALPAEAPAITGKWVLVNFWAEWCPPCRTELAELSANAAKLAAKNVAVLVVAVDDVKSTRLPFRIVRAHESTIELWSTLIRYLSDRRRDLGLPTSILINPQGSITKVYRGVTTAAEIVNDAGGEPAALPFAGQWHASKPVRNYNALATALAEKGFAGEARRLYETAITRGLASHDLLNNYAGLLLAAGDAKGAVLMLERVVDQAPNEPSARVNLARTLTRLGETSRAIEHVRMALAMQPDDQSSWALLARAEASAGRSREAMAAWRKAVESGGDRAEYLNEIGILHAQAGQMAEARSAFERASASDPKDTASQTNLALLHLQTGNTKGAREALDRARSLGENGQTFLLLEVQTLIAEGKPAQAKRILTEMLARNPANESARQLLLKLQP